MALARAAGFLSSHRTEHFLFDTLVADNLTALACTRDDISGILSLGAVLRSGRRHDGFRRYPQPQPGQPGRQPTRSDRPATRTTREQRRPTETMALLTGSPAIGGVDPGRQSAHEITQGLARGSSADIGTFQVVHAFVVTTLADETTARSTRPTEPGASLARPSPCRRATPARHDHVSRSAGTIVLGRRRTAGDRRRPDIAGPGANVLTIDGQNASREIEVRLRRALWY